MEPGSGEKRVGMGWVKGWEEGAHREDDVAVPFVEAAMGTQRH